MLEGHPLDQFGKMTLGEQFGSMLSTIKQSITTIKDAIIESERISFSLYSRFILQT
jgi:hypothetical protein